MASAADQPFHDASANLPAGFVRFTDVEARLMEAMTLLMRSPDRERGWIGGGGSSIWRMVQDDMSNDPAADDRPIITRAFTRQQQDRAAEALEWVVAWVPSGPTRRALGLALVSRVLGDGGRPDWPWIWQRMGGKAGGWTAEGLRKRYSRAITLICTSKNARTSAE